jgi:adenylate kinase family enzyme
MVKIGRRVAVYGPSGSGKTTVAARIARCIGVPHIELDTIFWKPNWTETPLEEFRSDVSSVLSSHPNGWVCDGNYQQVRDLVLPLADTVVWLRPPFRTAFWWLLKRTLGRARTRELLWGTNRESWWQSFFSRDSILLYQMAHWRRSLRLTKQVLQEIPHQDSVLELQSANEIDKFLATLDSIGAKE